MKTANEKGNPIVAQTPATRKEYKYNPKTGKVECHIVPIATRSPFTPKQTPAPAPRKTSNPATDETPASTALCFDDLKTAILADPRNADSLYNFCFPLARSVVRKVADPQAKQAQTADKVSNNGCNPVMLALIADIVRDNKTLVNTLYAMNSATEYHVNADGDLEQVTADSDAKYASGKLQSATLSDGMDLVHDVIVSLLETMQNNPPQNAEWFDTPIETRKLSRKVCNGLDSVPEWETIELAPVQIAFRSARSGIERNRSVKADPRNKCLYLADMSADPESDALDTFYRKIGKCADIGGYETDLNGNSDYSRPYTASEQTARDFDELFELLELTTAQRKLVNRLVFEHMPIEEIARCEGVTRQAIQDRIRKVREKCKKAGIVPACMQTPATAE